MKGWLKDFRLLLGVLMKRPPNIRPDGKRVWAIWSMSMDLAITLEIDGKIEEACNFLGEPVTLPENTTLTPGLIYLTGPKKITLHLRR